MKLNAIVDAWDKNKGGGRDENKARELSDTAVAENPAEFAAYDAMEEDQLVAMIDVFRSVGNPDEVNKIQTYLFHKYEPRDIGGAFKSIVRIPGSKK